MNLNPTFRWTVRLLASAAIIAAISSLYFHVAAANATTVALSFLLAILGIATAWGVVEALFASVLAVVSFNYLFLPRFALWSSPIRKIGSHCLLSW